MYIWQRAGWPGLTWESARLAALPGQVSREQGRLLGRMQDLGFDLRREAQLSTLTEDVVRSSEIEGEILDADQVRSSIARRLGIDIGALGKIISKRSALIHFSRVFRRWRGCRLTR